MGCMLGVKIQVVQCPVDRLPVMAVHQRDWCWMLASERERSYSISQAPVLLLRRMTNLLALLLCHYFSLLLHDLRLILQHKCKGQSHKQRTRRYNPYKIPC